jgi:hypothetical protein
MADLSFYPTMETIFYDGSVIATLTPREVESNEDYHYAVTRCVRFITARLDEVTAKSNG